MKKYLTLLVFFVFCSYGELRRFDTSIDNSKWSVIEATPITCTMEHNIQGFGTAFFSSFASKSPNMSFKLNMLARPNQVTEVSLISRAPSWRAGVLDHHLLDLQFQKYNDAEISSRVSWAMLSELESGMMPTFFYSDWSSPKVKVAVGLSPANFKIAYEEFKDCLSGLLKYNLKDYSFLVLNYTRMLEFSRESAVDLEKIKNYLAVDADLLKVEIDVYTDSYGGYEANRRVAVARRKQLVNFFVENGVDEDIIVAKQHIMDNYIDSNSTAFGRFKNRRAVVKIHKMY